MGIVDPQTRSLNSCKCYYAIKVLTLHTTHHQHHRETKKGANDNILNEKKMIIYAQQGRVQGTR